MADVIQIRRDTASAWTSANPTLASGELGIETDTDKVKVGDASTAWTSLSYLINTSGYAVTSGNLSQFAATTSAQLLGVLSDETGTGSAVFATSPTLVTPALGTPSALVLTNATGTLTSPTLVTPALGTPASGVATNLTGTAANLTAGNATLAADATTLATARTIHGVSFDGSANIDLSEEIADTVGAMVSGNTETNVTVTYEDGDNTLDFVIGTLNQDTTGNAATVTTNANLTGHVTSTGNAAVLGSFTSAQLSTALSDETGSGAAVFATSPTLVTPALGTPSALVLTNATGTLTSPTFVTPALGTPASGTLTNVSGLPAAGVVGTAATEGAANTFSALQTFSGSSSALATKIQSILENATISATAATGTVIFSLLTQSVLYYTTNASGNFTVNFRGDGSNTLNSLMAVGDVITCAFLATCGSTAYYNNVVHVDSSSVTPKWQGGTAPSEGNASSVDIYSYTIVKTANATFSIFAAQTQFA